MTVSQRLLPCVASMAALFLLVADLRAENISYTQSTLVAGQPTHGINGVVFGPDGKLYGSTMMGTGIIRVDVETGSIEKILIDQGSGDDLAFAPDGSLAWTALLSQEVRIQSPDGTIRTAATGLPWVNPIKFDNAGHMYVGQVTQPDTLIEYDLSGAKPPRKIGEGYGGINAFELDGKGGLIAPSTFKGQVLRIDIATGDATVIADGVGDVVAVRQGPDGMLYAVQWTGGQVLQINPDTGAHKVVAEPGPPLDNLAVGDDGMLYVARPSDTSIMAVNPSTGAYEFVIKGEFSASGGLVMTERNGKPTLLVSDMFGYRFVDPDTGNVTATEFDLFKKAASAIDTDGKHIALAHVQRGVVAVLDRETENVVNTWTGAKTPMSVVLHKNSVFVTDFKSGEVVTFTIGDPSTKRIIAYGLNGPVGLIVNDDGSMIVSEATGGRITRIEATGAKTVIARDLNQPEGIAVRTDGAIVVAEAGSQDLSTIDPNSGEVRSIASNLPIGDTIGQGAVPVYLPTGVVVAEDGTIYMTADKDNSILAFTPAP